MKLRDVAKKANVSIGTASMALSRNPQVAQRTRNRVIRVANQLGYSRNIHARSLAQNKSFLLGLLARETYWTFAPEVIQGIQEVCLAQEYSLVTYIHGDLARDEARHLDLSQQRCIDGLMVMPALDVDGRHNGPMFRLLREQGYPLVQLFHRCIPEAPSVCVDTVSATRQSIEYLLQRGHRRIAYLTFDAFNDTRIEGFYTEALDRYRAYEKTMNQAGLSPILFTHPGFDFEGEGEKLGQAVLNHPGKPTAVITYSDAQAWGLMKGIVKAGKRVPDDLSVIGAHALPFVSLDMPELVSYVHPEVLVGRSAAELCLKMLQNQSVEDVLLMPQFREGGTVRSIL